MDLEVWSDLEDLVEWADLEDLEAEQELAALVGLGE